MAELSSELASGGREDEEEIEESNGVEEENRSAISSAFLVELNLVMMVAFLTLSDDEFLRSEEDPEKIEDRRIREAVSKVKRRRHRLPEEFKASDRQAVSRSQTKILDSRHGRKM